MATKAAKEWRVAAYESRRLSLLFLSAVMLLGLALRLDLLIANNFVIDSDEAIVGLMARDIMLGKQWPIFYYGQHYMGSFEALLVALGFKLFGVNNFILKAIPLFFSIALIPLVYLMARRVCSEWGARAACLLMALPASPLVIWSSMARGGFIEVIFIGAVATLITLIWLEKEQPALVETILIGTLLGFGWWVNNQVVYFIFPLGLFMLLHSLRRGCSAGRPGSCVGMGLFLTIHFVAGLAAFVLGGAPFWIYNLQNDFQSFEMFGSAEQADVSSHLAGFFDLALPIILGAKRFWNSEDVFYGSSWVSYSLYLLLFLSMLVFRRAAMLRLFWLKVPYGAAFELFPLIFVTACAIFIFSSFGWLVQAPRYLLPLYLPLYIIAGGVLGRVHERSGALARVWLAALLVLNLSSQYLGGRAIPGEPHVFEGQRVSKDHSELISWLEKNEITAIRTNYWIGYRLAFETQERVKFLVFGEPHRERINWPELQATREEGRLLPHVLVENEAAIVRQALAALGIAFKEIKLSGYAVIYSLSDASAKMQRISAEEIGRLTALEVSHSSALAYRAIDGQINTRWGSAAPQSAGMSFALKFEQPLYLRGVSYSLGSWWHDYPRGLEISMQLEGGARLTLLRSEDWPAIRYYLGGAESITLDFAAISRAANDLTFAVQEIKFVQTASDPVFDWSIAELKFLR